MQVPTLVIYCCMPMCKLQVYSFYLQLHRLQFKPWDKTYDSFLFQPHNNQILNYDPYEVQNPSITEKLNLFYYIIYYIITTNK